MQMPRSEKSSEHCLPLTVLPYLRRSGIQSGVVQKRKSCFLLKHLFTDSNLPANALLALTRSGSGSVLTHAMFLHAVLYFKVAIQVVERTVLYYLYQ